MTKTTDIAARAVEALFLQYRGKARFEGLVRALAGEPQAVEDVLWSLLADRMLAAAAGEQLDVLGRVVGEQRQGRDDDRFRLWVRARIALNRSAGTVPEVLVLFGLVAAGVVELRAEPPAAFTLVVHGEVPEAPEALVGLLRAAKAAGVRAVLEWRDQAEAETFRFDDGPGWDDGLWAGAAE